MSPDELVASAVGACDVTEREAVLGLLACTMAQQTPDDAESLFLALATAICVYSGENIGVFLRRHAAEFEAEHSTEVPS